jgi:hypothetical protein
MKTAFGGVSFVFIRLNPIRWGERGFLYRQSIRREIVYVQSIKNHLIPFFHAAQVAASFYLVQVAL